MKVILTAFNGRLKSEIMEFPEDIGEFIYLPMPLDFLEFDPQKKYYKLGTPIMKRGKFRRTGRSWDVRSFGYKLAKNENPFAYEYVLVDID